MTNLGEIHGFFAKLAQGAAGQLMSRDVYRLATSLPLGRNLALIHSAFGFYLVDTISMALLFMVAYLFALLNAANLLGFFLGPSVSLLTLTGWMPLLVALVRTTPDVVMVQSQRGWAKAAYCTPIWPPQASRCVRLFCRSRVAAP
jgi:hypothetical protein